jgi:threonine dehydratase
LSPKSPELPRFSDVEAAAARLKSWAVRTPLLEAPALSERLGFRLFVKAESLQRTGSFKFRGAFNRISRLDEAERQRGVVAFSSGNHAQGVACASQLLGIPATIVMPADAPAIKLANTRGYGAEIVTYDRAKEDREAIARGLAEQRGLTLIRPFDDPFVIAGQGTVALEAIEDAAARGIAFDALVAPASGGGLVAGCALAAEALSPGAKIYAAEPIGLDDHARSLASGRRVGNVPGAHSICDALLGTIPGEITFAINRQRLAGGLVTDDDEVRQAMVAAFQELKLVLEPSGAVALAAVLADRLPGEKHAVCIVASGGNVDRDAFIEALKA